jgi:hypothetical protein
MRSLAPCLLALSLSALSFLAASSEDAPSSGIATLYARDDLLSSFDFRSGGPGAKVWDGEVDLGSAQIVYDVLARGCLSIGFSLDERVDVLDLGEVRIPPRERSRDRQVEFPISLFHTLEVRDEGFVFQAAGGDRDPYAAADRILSATPTTGLRHFEPQLGHTYLLRIRRNNRSENEVYKFEPIGILPGHSLTLRWGRVQG